MTDRRNAFSADPMNTMLNLVEGYTEEMTALRRSFHAKPETGWTEFRTTAILVEHLKALGLEVRQGLDVINPDFVMGRYEEEVEAGKKRALREGVSQEALDAMQGYTGALAVLDTGRPGPVTALRFDIDALYVPETDDPEHLPNRLGFASEHPGLMHACGHDCHAGVGAALAHWAVDHKDELCGVIKFIFQPAEEGTRGALAMAERGIVDDVDNLIASHIACTPRLGHVTVTDPGYNATIKFDVHFEGRPAHSVANPQDGRNALMAACHTAVMVGSLPRHGAGLTTVSCGRIVGGEMRNVIPVKAVMQMEVRGATNELCEYVFSQVERAVKSCAEAFDVKFRIVKVGQAYNMNPSPDLARIIEDSAAETVGSDNVDHYSEKGGSEDATILMARVQKLGGRAAHFYYGADHKGNHRSDFDPDDVRSMPVGFTVHTRILQRLNGRNNPSI